MGDTISWDTGVQNVFSSASASFHRYLQRKFLRRRQSFRMSLMTKLALYPDHKDDEKVSFIHCRHSYSAPSSWTIQKRFQSQRRRIMLFSVAEGISGRSQRKTILDQRANHGEGRLCVAEVRANGTWRRPCSAEQRWRVLPALREGQQRSVMLSISRIDEEIQCT